MSNIISQSEIDFILRDDENETKMELRFLVAKKDIQYDFAKPLGVVNGYNIYHTNTLDLFKFISETLHKHRYLFDAGQKNTFDKQVYDKIVEYITEKQPELIFSFPIDITQIGYNLELVYVLGKHKKKN